MEIQIASLLRGAQEAEGTAIVIDVFRAFTTGAVAFSRGAKKIVLVAEVSEALTLKSQGVGQMCIGEVAGMRPEGFDLGNSPYDMSQADVEGKTLIQSTRAGTVGMTTVTKADQLYAGSFVIASATVEAVKRRNPELVTIVAMGAGGANRTDEDEQCALFLRNSLQGREPDYDSVRNLILAGSESQKYDDPSQPHFKPQDKEIALRINAFPFAIKVNREKGLLVARREDL
ncbi:MAG: 2-phosphosulfolactate phosphatase [SAR202 cluster bacterium]|jgi:2-phosphosulfolactate phosphatase|nr:2-phosphosulfolactate phosphatase [SAR202 cluster bacterium]MDP6514547.1 2-phosphosulfolactate phosphatase [SAR202 cluster bacterium]MDP6716334.1 2-phosphosulfolactate phosphatase [SAR202 cluster bacterium]